MKSILNNWMERIFLYKEIPRNEFTYKNAKKLVSVSDPREKITKKELDDIVSEFKRTQGPFKRTQGHFTKGRGEVQSHGFRWEQEVLKNIYNHHSKIKYTNEIDLPGELNDGINLSIKTTGSYNTVCMADCLRFFDSLVDKLHLMVILYKQVSDKKVIERVVQLDLTNSTKLLFGDLTRNELEEFVKKVKEVPSNRKPTDKEHKEMYKLRDKLQDKLKYIKLNIKCNSTQTRVQCSFNKFKKFLEENKKLIITDDTGASDTEIVKYWFPIGNKGYISSFIKSSPRKFYSGSQSLSEH